MKISNGNVKICCDSKFHELKINDIVVYNAYASNMLCFGKILNIDTFYNLALIQPLETPYHEPFEFQTIKLLKVSDEILAEAKMQGILYGQFHKE
jgi:hypothetical protein